MVKRPVSGFFISVCPEPVVCGIPHYSILLFARQLFLTVVHKQQWWVSLYDEVIKMMGSATGGRFLPVVNNATVQSNYRVFREPNSPPSGNYPVYITGKGGGKTSFSSEKTLIIGLPGS